MQSGPRNGSLPVVDQLRLEKYDFMSAAVEDLRVLDEQMKSLCSENSP